MRFHRTMQLLKHSPAMAHNLAVEYSEEPELKHRAIPLMQLAISTEPLYLSAISDLGYLYQLGENFSQAEEVRTLISSITTRCSESIHPVRIYVRNVLL